MANLLRTICTKFYQNWSGFIEDITKHFGVFFRFTVYIGLHVHSATATIHLTADEHLS